MIKNRLLVKNTENFYLRILKNFELSKFFFAGAISATNNGYKTMKLSTLVFEGCFCVTHFFTLLPLTGHLLFFLKHFVATYWSHLIFFCNHFLPLHWSPLIFFHPLNFATPIYIYLFIYWSHLITL